MRKFLEIGHIGRSAAAGLLVFSAALGPGCGGPEGPGPAREISDLSIVYQLKRLEIDPDHYPSHAMLAVAYLDLARETADIEKLALARDHAKRSLKIQPSLEAFKAMARIEGFEHRFEESVKWAGMAAASSAGSVADGETTAILVDAYLGLGRNEEARRVIDGLSEDGFHKQAALGSYYRATGKVDEAARAFMNASEFALRENAGKAQAWAEVMVAGVWIDFGDHHRAVRHLEKATKIDADSKAVKVHRAEFHEKEGELDTAADIYRSVLETSKNPELQHRLFNLYRMMGRNSEAKQQFALAESGYRRIVESGHIFALGPLAQLLCDAGDRPDEAKRLSTENLKYKRDAEALATEQCVSQMAR